MTEWRFFRRTLVDIFLTFGRQFVAGAMQLGLLLIVARLLGAEGAGIYGVALLLPTLMSQLLNLGVASANVYFIASGQYSLMQVWAASRDLVLVTGAIGMAISVYLVAEFGDVVFPEVPEAVLYAALIIFPSSLLVGVIVGLFQALEDFRSFNLIVLVQPAAALIGAILLWLGDIVTLLSILYIIALSHAIGLAVAIFIMARLIPIFGNGGGRWEYIRSAVPYGLKLQLSNLISFLNYRLDLFLINLLAGPNAAGLYSIAVTLVEQLWLISKAVSTVIYPRLSAMSKEEDARRSYTTVMARSVLWITTISATALAAIAKTLIFILFGPEFVEALVAVYILLPGIAILSCSRVLANDFAARGWVGINLTVATLALVFNTVANVILIPFYGIVGAAVATSLAYIAVFVARVVLHQFWVQTKWWAFLVPSYKDISSLSRAVRRKKFLN